MLVHLALLFAFVAWTGRSGLGGFSLPDSTVLLAGIAVVLGLTGIALAFRKIRKLVLASGRDGGARGRRSEIAGVLRSPVRVVALLGGAAGTTLAYVLALAACDRGVRRRTQRSADRRRVSRCSLVGNAAPTPGGLGAVEAALVAALTGFGLDSGAAVSAVLTFRLATYWLPTLPGWFVFRWMQNHDEI